MFLGKHLSNINNFLNHFIRFISIYSPLAEALQVRDVIYDVHMNPHVLLFAAFCAFKMNPRKTNITVAYF